MSERDPIDRVKDFDLVECEMSIQEANQEARRDVYVVTITVMGYLRGACKPMVNLKIKQSVDFG